MIKQITSYLFLALFFSAGICHVAFACNSNISGTTIICSAGSATLYANTGTSYVWSTGATTQSITTTIPGNYIVTVTDNSSCTSSASVAVTTSALPAPNINTSISLSGFCTATVSGSSNVPGAIYTWTGPGTSPTNVNPLTIIYSGTYVLTIFNPANGCSSSGIVSGGFPGSAIIKASDDVTICPGNSTVLTVTGGSNYTWVPSTGLSSATGSPVTATPDTTTTYVVTNTTGFFGCVSTDTVTVTVVNSLPASITGNLSFCTGGNTTLTANTGSSYVWSTGATTQSINVNMAGSYTVTVTQSGTCPSSSATATVTNSNTNANISGNLNICNGVSTVLTANAGSTYLWSTGATTQAITVNVAANYAVTVKQANGCSATANVNVIDSAPVLSPVYHD